jgi:hypothetical protein
VLLAQKISPVGGVGTKAAGVVGVEVGTPGSTMIDVAVALAVGGIAVRVGKNVQLGNKTTV